jgi:hypothetical protein
LHVRACIYCMHACEVSPTADSGISLGADLRPRRVQRSRRAGTCTEQQRPDCCLCHGSGRPQQHDTILPPRCARSAHCKCCVVSAAVWASRVSAQQELQVHIPAGVLAPGGRKLHFSDVGCRRGRERRAAAAKSQLCSQLQCRRAFRAGPRRRLGRDQQAQPPTAAGSSEGHSRWRWSCCRECGLPTCCGCVEGRQLARGKLGERQRRSHTFPGVTASSYVHAMAHLALKVSDRPHLLLEQLAAQRFLALGWTRCIASCCVI